MELAELFSQLLIDLQSVFRKNNKHLSLSLSQVVVLSSIPVDGITMSNLSHRIGVDNSTLTRLIGILEHKGLVERRKNKNDRRSKLVNLTKVGENNIKVIEENTLNLSEKVLKSFSQSEKASFKDVLSSLKKTGANTVIGQKPKAITKSSYYKLAENFLKNKGFSLYSLD